MVTEVEVQNSTESLDYTTKTQDLYVQGYKTYYFIKQFVHGFYKANLLSLIMATTQQMNLTIHYYHLSSSITWIKYHCGAG